MRKSDWRAIAALFLFELRLLAGSPLTWTIFSVLLGLTFFAALNAEQHASGQRNDLARVRAEQHANLARHREATVRYATPAPEPLPYWQDPTDVAGYMRYQLEVYATKPVSPLAALAIGQSRLLPYYIRTELDYTVPPEATFDYQNPRALSMGEVDLAFVLVVLLPLAIIALAAPRLANERDSGALPLLILQAGSLKRLARLKCAALVALTVPVTICGLALCLLLVGVPLLNPALSVPLLICCVAVVTYIVFWACLATAIASRTGAVSSISILGTLWISMTFVLPAVSAHMLDLLHPPPSRLQYLMSLRQVSTVLDQQRDQVFAAFVADTTQYGGAARRIDQVPYATKQIAVQLELERRLSSVIARFDHTRLETRRSANWLARLSPALVLHSVMQTTAGNDADRHARFLVDVRDYIDELRAFFWPRALRQAAHPRSPCPRCSARLNFTEHELIPAFTERSPLERVSERAIADTLYLVLFALTAVALLNLRRA